MKHSLQYLTGILCTFSLMIILLITSVEAVTYWTPGYYEAEYAKYHVLDEVQMEMEDLLEVTEEMMAYLRGDREDLHIMTTIAGQTREFFNAREIAHMEDVRNLFLGGIILRRICLSLLVTAVGILYLTKAELKRLLPRTLCLGTILFFAALAGLSALISTDFTKYFIIFHEIFFTNDLWMLDPSTDLLINIVPEPFFVDTAARIALVYGACVTVVFAVCLICLRLQRRHKKI